MRPHQPPGRPGGARHHGQDDISDSDLRIRPGYAPVPVSGGQPCPPGIAAIWLTVADTARIERLAREHAAGQITRARPPSAPLVPMAARLSGPSPLLPLQHPAAGRSSHLTYNGQKEMMTGVNANQTRHVTVRDAATSNRETATVLPVCLLSHCCAQR